MLIGVGLGLMFCVDECCCWKECWCCVVERNVGVKGGMWDWGCGYDGWRWMMRVYVCVNGVLC